jgi:DNA-binding NarL/FixJ family response regulator
VATRMKISFATAKQYGGVIHKKLGLHSTVDLVVWYWKQKYAELQQQLTEAENELIHAGR